VGGGPRPPPPPPLPSIWGGGGGGEGGIIIIRGRGECVGAHPLNPFPSPRSESERRAPPSQDIVGPSFFPRPAQRENLGFGGPQKQPNAGILLCCSRLFRFQNHPTRPKREFALRPWGGRSFPPHGRKAPPFLRQSRGNWISNVDFWGAGSQPAPDHTLGRYKRTWNPSAHVKFNELKRSN